MTCQHCGATDTSRNGTNANGTPRYRCKVCGKTGSKSTGASVGRKPRGEVALSPAQKQKLYRERLAQRQDRG